MPNVLYEDNHIIVVEKPPNVLTQADRTGDKDILSIVKEYIKHKYKKPGNVFLGLVHRLDRPVGGVMVFARTSKAASRLSEQVRSRQFEKVYLAVTHGKPKPHWGRLTHYLLKDNTKNIVKPVAPNTKGAKEAVLEYKTISSSNGFGLVNIQLETGRPHQIRVQFSTIGNPLYGDTKYGNVKDKGQIALWASSLRFNHPTLKKKMTFESKPPSSNYPWNLFSY